MPHDVLLAYLKEVEKATGDLRDAYVELYEEEFLGNERVNLRIRVRFYNGCLLQLNEAVIFQAKIEHLGYRYHFQDKNSDLIFRYDNTPHFPELPNFPHHRHNPAGTEPSTSPSILAAIAEAAELCKNYERT
ncbi:MAG: DUF6516 family protein [Desulfobacterales bacterium]|jgi:hypothetical protein|nr:DUF6516 family protein [Desulfobacterales bacterium]